MHITNEDVILVFIYSGTVFPAIDSVNLLVSWTSSIAVDVAVSVVAVFRLLPSPLSPQHLFFSLLPVHPILCCPAGLTN